MVWIFLFTMHRANCIKKGLVLLNYKILGDGSYDTPLETFLENRGIKDINGYINVSEDILIPYQNLDNIDKAIEVYKSHIENNSNITIIVDCDVDGYTSASIIYAYTKNLNPECKLTYLLHTGKQHGLTDDIEIPEDTQLLIIPDAGTNDTEQCKGLKDKGIDIIILDHHDREIDNPYAIVVNNQCSLKYDNKNLCGAGIVYKFLQAVDEDMWCDEADDYLDLVALANISDNMDMKEPETKYLVSKGLNFITNAFFKEMLKKQSYYFPDGTTIIGVQFYITPLINALIRIGSQEEKDILFRAFIGDESETFDYTKPRTKEQIKESIYERAVRLCSNAKGRQKTIVDKQLPLIINHIKNKGQDKHEVIVTNVTDYIESTMTGVVAIKVAGAFHKPTILLRDRGNDVYGGSVRVPDTSPIENFKNMLNTMTFFSAQGHPSACGTTIFKHNIKESIETLDDYIEEMELTGIADTPVDFEIDYDDLNISLFRDIAELKPYYATGLKECNVLVKNIPINADDIVIQGKGQDTWCTMICDESIKLIKFKCPEDDVFLDAQGVYKINVIGKFGYSFFNGIKTAQIIIEDYEVVN